MRENGLENDTRYGLKEIACHANVNAKQTAIAGHVRSLIGLFRNIHVAGSSRVRGKRGCSNDREEEQNLDLRYENVLRKVRVASR